MKAIEGNYKDWSKQPKRIRKPFREFHAARMTRGFAFLHHGESDVIEKWDEAKDQYRVEADEYFKTNPHLDSH